MIEQDASQVWTAPRPAAEPYPLDVTETDLLAYRLVEATEAEARERGRDHRVLLASIIVLIDRAAVESWLAGSAADRHRSERGTMS